MLFSKNIDKINYQDINSFLALDLPEEQRPHEGLRVDFKSSFPSDLPKLMVAFANTSGGIILLGIKENQGIPQKICGIELGKEDIRTRITEIGHSAIDPPLIPEVGFCRFPNDNTRGVVVIRIQESQYPPHMVIKGGENTIYIRINDQCIKADLRTIEALFAKRKYATETLNALLSKYGELVELEDIERGFRAFAIIPEIPRENMIEFNRQTDIFFSTNKPDLVGLNAQLISIRGGVLYKEKIESVGGKYEYRFSVTKEGVVNFSETLFDWEKGVGLDRTIEVLEKILKYAKRIYNNFNYYGRAHIRVRIGRVQGKILTIGGSPYCGIYYKAVCDELSEDITIRVEDIREDNLEILFPVISNLIRGLFNLALDEGELNTLVKEGIKHIKIKNWPTGRF